MFVFKKRSVSGMLNQRTINIKVVLSINKDYQDSRNCIESGVYGGLPVAIWV